MIESEKKKREGWDGLIFTDSKISYIRD
jgi:hypothetical protein